MSLEKYPPIDYDALKERFGDNAGPRIVINPRTGNRQIQFTSNDVSCAIYEMGGVKQAAETLGVEEIEIEHWIDDHYVPDRYAALIKLHTGFSILSLQIPGFDVDRAIAVIQG